MTPDAPLECRVYRCGRQPEMYLYLREGVAVEDLPEDLRRRTGQLTQVMALPLHRQRRLARADVGLVIDRLREVGWYLQLPPQDRVQAHLHFGD